MVKALINQMLEIEQALITIGREIAKQFHSKSKNQNTLKYFESFVKCRAQKLSQRFFKLSHRFVSYKLCNMKLCIDKTKAVSV